MAATDTAEADSPPDAPSAVRPTRRDQILAGRPTDAVAAWTAFRASCPCPSRRLPATHATRDAARDALDGHRDPSGDYHDPMVRAVETTTPPRVAGGLASDVVDVLADHSERGLRLTHDTPEGTRTAVLWHDPDADANRPRAPAGGGDWRPAQYYWRVVGRDPYGRTYSRERALTRPDAVARVTGWRVDTLADRNSLTAVLDAMLPDRQWFWARDWDAIDAQLQAEYGHDHLYVANRDSLVPAAAGFAVEQTVVLAVSWPEQRTRDWQQSGGDGNGAGWDPADHNPRTGTDDVATVESCRFLSVPAWSGYGYHVLAVPPKVRVRAAFERARPTPEGDTQSCEACGRERPGEASFCDWCGSSLRTYDRSVAARMRGVLGRVVGRLPVLGRRVGVSR